MFVIHPRKRDTMKMAVLNVYVKIIEEKVVANKDYAKRYQLTFNVKRSILICSERMQHECLFENIALPWKNQNLIFFSIIWNAEAMMVVLFCESDTVYPSCNINS